jgi:hypothetical protein
MSRVLPTWSVLTGTLATRYVQCSIFTGLNTAGMSVQQKTMPTLVTPQQSCGFVTAPSAAFQPACTQQLSAGGSVPAELVCQLGWACAG